MTYGQVRAGCATSMGAGEMSCVSDEHDERFHSLEEGPRETAMAIRRCLESLVKDARRGDLGDLAEFLSLAVLAADDAARAAIRRHAMTTGAPPDLINRKVAGSC